MKASALIVVLFMATILAPQVQETEAQTWVALLPAIVKKLLPLWGGGNQEFLGHTCTFSRRPKIKRFQLYHETSIVCPGLSGSIKGKGFTRSFSGAVRDAMKDYLEKAIAKGVVTEAQAEEWLKSR